MAPQAATSSRRADVAKGLLSLLGLVALVVAVPILLIAFVGWPLPRGVPSFDDITTALGDRYVPDRFLVGALAVVCWIIWTELVASVVVEAIALARGRTAAQVPLARGTQLAAARLVAGIALLAALFASRGETPDAVRVLTPAPATELDASFADLEVEAESTARADAPTYTVQPRDTLWDISERCLGDPFRWTEIWTINQHRTMPDGRQFNDPDRIHPGWVLNLPGDAQVAEMVAATPAEATPAALDSPAPAPDPADGSRIEVLLPAGGGQDGTESSRIEVLLPVDEGSSRATALPAADTSDTTAHDTHER